MLPKPRHILMLDVLKAEPTVLVRDLAVRAGVSESTIRRDLAELETQGLVRRLYGGAVLENRTTIQRELPFEVRQTKNALEKRLIGERAARLVSDGDVIYLDAGTTTEEIVPHLLSRRHLTVVTNGLNITTALANVRHISTITIGGELNIDMQSFTGPLALETFRLYQLRCDIAFLGAGGVSAQHGIMNQNLDGIVVKRQALATARTSVLVVDGSKIGRMRLGFLAPVQVCNTLITDSSAPATELEQIAALGVEVIIA